MNLAVKFNLLKNTQPHYSYTPESCLENDSYKLYFDRTILTDIHIKHNRPNVIILNKQQKCLLLVLSTECLFIWVVFDLNTQVRAAVYSLRVYKLLVKAKNYPPVVSGRGGWLPGPTG
jgi:hypothetical protein